LLSTQLPPLRVTFMSRLYGPPLLVACTSRLYELPSRVAFLASHLY
jgi:hypothetical protein